MKVLMLSTDKNLLIEKTPVRQRMEDYAKLVQELHVILLNKKIFKHKPSIKIAANAFLYPTDSYWRVCSLLDAVKIGKKIVNKDSGGWLVSSQDPFENGLIGWQIAKKKKNPPQLQNHKGFGSPFFL